MHADKKDSGRFTVCSWSPELAKLNSTFSRVARRNLPTAPPSRALSQDILRRWERAAREQSVMCNHAAGCQGVLIGCRMLCLHISRTYIQANARSSPLKECSKLWTNWNIWLQNRTHTALLPSIYSHFSQTSFSTAEVEVAKSEERRLSSQSHRKPGRFHPYASNDKLSHQQDWKSSIPAWKQIRER